MLQRRRAVAAQGLVAARLDLDRRDQILKGVKNPT